MASSKHQLSEGERLARDVFSRLAAATDEFEGYAHPHAERVASLSDALAKLFHLGRADRASLRLAALAHDMGEASMKRDYIKRPGVLTQEERLDLARHPVIGEQEAARAGADRAAQLTVRWSHEWWNGGGYPDVLRGEQIPLAARLLRVADSYCSLTDDRPFRRAFTEDEARRHLAEWAGIEFDPRVVRAFLTLHGLPELRSHARRAQDADARPDEGAHTDDSAAATNATPAPSAPDANVDIATRATGGGYDDRSLGGHVPEAGTNPYASAGVGNDAGAVGRAAADGDEGVTSSGTV